MKELVDLRDERIFPVFANCPKRDVDQRFYDELDNGVLKPKHHWCLLAEILNATKIHKHHEGEKLKCNTCGKSEKPLLRCGKCNLFWYCDKVCSSYAFLENLLIFDRLVIWSIGRKEATRRTARS